jgi:hypothetical protein
MNMEQHNNNEMEEIHWILDRYFERDKKRYSSVITEDLVMIHAWSISMNSRPDHLVSRDVFFDEKFQFLEDKVTELVSRVLRERGFIAGSLKIRCFDAAWDASRNEGTFTVEVRRAES